MASVQIQECLLQITDSISRLHTSRKYPQSNAEQNQRYGAGPMVLEGIVVLFSLAESANFAPRL